MKKMRFELPYYRVWLTLIQVEGKEDAGAVGRYLKSVGADKENIDEITDAISRGACNGGEAFRDLRNRRMLVIFYTFENEEVKVETYAHEKRHVEDRVLQYFGVDDIESAGLLAGYLGVVFHNFGKL